MLCSFDCWRCLKQKVERLDRNPDTVRDRLDVVLLASLGLMFFNLRIAMGQDVAISEDRRVWIVRIVDPANPNPANTAASAASGPNLAKQVATDSGSASAPPVAQPTTAGVPQAIGEKPLSGRRCHIKPVYAR